MPAPPGPAANAPLPFELPPPVASGGRPAANAPLPFELHPPVASQDGPSICDASSIPTLVINLPKRTDRWSAFTAAQPQWMRERTIRVDGINGSALPSEMPASIIAPDVWTEAISRTVHEVWTSGTQLTQGAVGLAMAHASAWRRIVDANIPVAMIAEDDLRFYTHDFASWVEKVCTTAVHVKPDGSETYDLVQLQNCHQGWEKPGSGDAGCDASCMAMTVDDVLSTREAGYTMLQDNMEYCLGLYLITQRGARNALRAAFPITKQLDTPTYAQGPLKALNTSRVVPPVAQCDERLVGSDVQITSRRSAAHERRMH